MRTIPPRKRYLPGVLATVIVLLGVTFAIRNPPISLADRRSSPAQLQQSRSKKLEAVSSVAVGFGRSRPTAEIAKRERFERRRESNEDEKEAAENRAVRHVTKAALEKNKKMAATGLQQDGALQTLAPTANMPDPTLTFEGNSNLDNHAKFGSLPAPPDTNGDVGPNHYVQHTNSLIRIWNKTGSPLTGTFGLGSLWAESNGGPGGVCADPRGDPVVVYDALADRWVLSEFYFFSDGFPPYHECIAVSQTPDPTGSYFLYDFLTPGVELPDYPKLAVWPDGYYMMVHQFFLGESFDGTGVFSFNRVKMLAGDPSANYIYFDLNLANYPEVIGGGLFADIDGISPPPPGAPAIFAYLTVTDFGDPNNGIRLFNFHPDFANPLNSTFAERPESSYATPIPVAPFSVVTPRGPNGRQAIPQPSPASNSGSALDAITDRFMHRLQYRNRGNGVETLVVTHTVGAPASPVFGVFRAAPRYYELRNTGSGYSVFEQGTFAPGGSPGDNISRWMGSAAEDNHGNLAVGYSVSSGEAGGNVFPSIRYAGRLANDPPGGLFQGEATLFEGTGFQGAASNRWGDYSSLTLDPNDDCTFWYTNQYYKAEQSANGRFWQTRIGNFKFPNCTAPAQGKAQFIINNCAIGGSLAGALVSIDGIPYGVTLPDGTYEAVLVPGPHSFQVSKNSSAFPSNASGNFNVAANAVTSVPSCLQGVPNVDVTRATLSSESCAPSNGGIDPGETVTVDFCVQNTGAGNATNLIGTLLSGGGVTAPSAPQSYGIVSVGGPPVCRSFTFTASGNCGGTINANFQLQNGSNDLGTVMRSFVLGVPSTAMSEGFDGVAAPVFPTGWTTSHTGAGVDWVTSSANATSAPNAAFAPDFGDVGTTSLVSSSILVPDAGARLTFKNLYNTEIDFDGMVLEISIAGGPFTDIVEAGGNFVAGGYNRTLTTFRQGPLAGRMAWSGLSSGTFLAPDYITTVVDLPPAASGQNVKLRWLLACDQSGRVGGGTGAVRVDDIVVSNLLFPYTCCGVTQPQASSIQFSSTNYSAGEGDRSTVITVTRTGGISGTSTVNFSTPITYSDCTLTNGTAVQNCDFIHTTGTLTFAPGETTKTFRILIVDDLYVEGSEGLNLTLFNPLGAKLGPPKTAILNIIDNDTQSPSTNPLENADARFFVRQQYFDFLGSDPDPVALDSWASQITSCPPSDQACINAQRIRVSDAFFSDPDFQQTSAYIFRLYRAAYGDRQPFPNPRYQTDFVIPAYSIIQRDRAHLPANVAQMQLDFANTFVNTPQFITKYPANLSTQGFINAILTSLRMDSLADLTPNNNVLLMLYQQGGRGLVLFHVANDYWFQCGSAPAPCVPPGFGPAVDNRSFINAEYNRSLLLNAFFGYLRRDPTAAEFDSTLANLNRFPLRDPVARKALICSFINSLDYQQRFSSVVVNSNQNCGLVPIQLFLEESPPGLNQAAALDSLSFLRDPFPVINSVDLLNQGTDRNTRVVLFVANLQLLPNEPSSAVIINLIDNNNQVYDIPAEVVRSVPGFSFVQVTFRLPNTVAIGTCVITVRAHGQISNIGTIRIRI